MKVPFPPSKAKHHGENLSLVQFYRFSAKCQMCRFCLHFLFSATQLSDDKFGRGCYAMLISYHVHVSQRLRYDPLICGQMCRCPDRNRPAIMNFTDPSDTPGKEIWGDMRWTWSEAQAEAQTILRKMTTEFQGAKNCETAGVKC